MGRSILRHAAALALFAAAAIAWTWPLARHLGDALPGGPGDNYSFVWNLWWMRRALATPGVEFFRTTFLFAPFGASLADHPHTALQGFAGATLLRSLSVVSAENVIVLASVFANMAAMYALAWDGTRRWRASILAAVVFGLSPYFAVHLLGHFDLMFGATIPLFALLVIAACERRSNAAAVGAGLVAAAAAYSAYYYVVYIGLFSAAYAVAWSGALAVATSRRAATARLRAIRGAAMLAIGALAGAAIGVAATGGWTFAIAGGALSMRRPENLLSLMWIAVLAAAMTIWRIDVRVQPESVPRIRRAAIVFGVAAAVFLVACAPLVREAVDLLARGEYVSQTYFWRSAPKGVDLASVVLGHPLLPLTASATQRAYAWMGVNFVETVGWLGVVPLLLTMAAWRQPLPRDMKIWTTVGAVFFLWALGPSLTIAGVDTGLKLPEILARYVPFVSNARMPGRAMVGVSLAIAMLIATSVAKKEYSPLFQWLLIALVAVEYCAAPIPLTALDRPPVYLALALQPAGAVCEVPIGIGDGLDAGVGSQERRVLYYATIHEHPLVGGYIGRMPPAARERYASMPVVRSLLRLSADPHTAPVPAADDLAANPCRYFVVNRATAAAPLIEYIHRLPLVRIAGDAKRDLYRAGR